MVVDGQAPSPVVTPPAAGGRPAGRRPTRSRGWLVAVALLIILGQMAFAMVTAARSQSATADEPVYVGAAAIYLHRDSLRYNIEHPPLAKEIMAVGLHFTSMRTDGPLARTEWRNGDWVLYRPGNDADDIMFAARLAMIVLTLLFGLVVFGFARDLTGSAGGLIAVAAYSLTPDVIANGSLATVDLPAAGFLLTAAWMLWRARRRPLLYLPLAGAFAGAAVASKMTALVALPVVALLAGLSGWTHDAARPRGGRLVRAVAAAAGVTVLAVVTVWATYLIVDPHLRYGVDDPVPVIGGLKGLIIDWLPFPKPFRDGMRIQFGFETMSFGGFLLGQSYRGHHWYYLPVALLIKEPLGAMALWLGGTAVLLWQRALRPAAPYLLLPALLLFGAALTGTRDFGVRYAIVVPVFLSVAAAGVVAVRARWVPVTAAALVLFMAVSAWRAYPYYLPYANEAWGGPARTSRLLNDSNSDWGQDLKRSAEWVNRNRPGAPVYLDYHGGGSARYYGLNPVDPSTVPASTFRGVVVVSNTRLYSDDAVTRQLTTGARKLTEIGYSMTIFERA